MKPQIIAILASISIILCACCDTNRDYAGSYSYKSYAILQIQDEETEDIQYQTYNKLGQLQIVKDHKLGQKSLLLTYHNTLGETYTAQGKIERDTLFITPYKRTENLANLSSLFEIEVESFGILYDDETIVFTEKYIGKTLQETSKKHFISTEATTIAHKN